MFCCARHVVFGDEDKLVLSVVAIDGLVCFLENDAKRFLNLVIFIFLVLIIGILYRGTNRGV